MLLVEVGAEPGSGRVGEITKSSLLLPGQPHPRPARLAGHLGGGFAVCPLPPTEQTVK